MRFEVDLGADGSFSLVLTLLPLGVEMSAGDESQPGVFDHAGFEFLERRETTIPPTVRNAQRV